jgi:hypothetical protein
MTVLDFRAGLPRLSGTARLHDSMLVVQRREMSSIDSKLTSPLRCHGFLANYLDAGIIVHITAGEAAKQVLVIGSFG